MIEQKKVYISVVTPIYGCSGCLPKLYERLEKTLSFLTKDFEIIMVNDASPDNAWEIIKELAQKDKRVKGINFSRNFGQHRAISAGIDYAEGGWVVVMDCDLQDQPEEIIKLYDKAQEGYDIVFGQRSERNDILSKKIGSKVFYYLYDYLSESNTDHSIANFSIVSRKVVDNYKKLGEQHRPYGYFINWLGFSRTHIEIKHAKRLEGKTSYTMSKLINLALDNIVSQSNKPLKLSIKIGFSLSILSASYALYLIVKYFTADEVVAGWTSVMVSIYFVAGMLLANLGFIGLYIGKVFDETKARPAYIIEDIV